MASIRSLAKRVALRVSAVVARHELFERPGERPLQSVLSAQAWNSGPSDVLDTPGVSMDVAAFKPQLLTAAPIKRMITQGPAIVHHWATWCESCMTETEPLKALNAGTNVPLIGVSWDGFEAPSADAALADVAGVVQAHAMAWAQVVVKGGAPHFFKTLNIQLKTVPQTWLIDAHGQVTERIEGPISKNDIDALIMKANAL